jgi:hypothetical protein
LAAFIRWAILFQFKAAAKRLQFSACLKTWRSLLKVKSLLFLQKLEIRSRFRILCFEFWVSGSGLLRALAPRGAAGARAGLSGLGHFSF